MRAHGTGAQRTKKTTLTRFEHSAPVVNSTLRLWLIGNRVCWSPQKVVVFAMPKFTKCHWRYVYEL